jgi:hypothetical protein
MALLAVILITLAAILFSTHRRDFDQDAMASRTHGHVRLLDKPILSSLRAGATSPTLISADGTEAIRLKTTLNQSVTKSPGVAVGEDVQHTLPVVAKKKANLLPEVAWLMSFPK